MPPTAQTDILSMVEAARQPPVIDFDVLVKAACRSFEIIEPWHQATSENPVVLGIIHRVQEQGINFFTAVTTSVDAAHQGHIFCKDFATVFRYLQDRNVNGQELREMIDNMQKLARQARRNAKQVADQFGTLRRDLYTISNDVPAEVSRVADQEQHLKKKIETGQKRIRQVKIAKACSIAAAAVVTGVAVVTFPPALLFLPVILPITTLVAEYTEMRLVKKNEKREKQARDCRDAIEQLNNITQDLDQLEKSICQFADFWSRQETVLDIIKGRLEDLRGSRHITLRLKNIHESWEEVGKSLLDYSIKLKTLRTYVPSVPSTSSLGDASPIVISISDPASAGGLRRRDALKRVEGDSPTSRSPISSTKGQFLAPPERPDLQPRSRSSEPRHIPPPARSKSPHTSTNRELEDTRTSKMSTARSSSYDQRDGREPRSSYASTRYSYPSRSDTHSYERSRSPSRDSHRSRSSYHSHRSRSVVRSTSPARRSRPPSYDGCRSRSPRDSRHCTDRSRSIERSTSPARRARPPSYDERRSGSPRGSGRRSDRSGSVERDVPRSGRSRDHSNGRRRSRSRSPYDSVRRSDRPQNPPISHRSRPSC